MKITDLTITLHRWEVPITSYSEVFGGAKQLGVVTVKTDEGVEGHSFLGNANQGADEFSVQVLQRLKPMVMGRNPLDIGAIWKDLWKASRRVLPHSICAIDVALWDIAGKVANLPIHRLLGTCRDKVPAYASSQVLTRPEEYVEQVLSYRERGWQAYKIHPVKQPKRDIEISTAVKNAVGETMVLMLDSSWGYHYEDAVRVGLAIQELGYHWYEDPLQESDLYNYVKLRQKLNIPILATEYAPGGFYAYTSWITERATDMLRGDVAVKGGLTPMIKLAHLAEAFGMQCEVHHGGNSLNNVANLHLIMAIPNCEYFEVLLPDEAQKRGLVRDIEVDTEGFVHAPTGPGLGYEIDWDLIERNKIGVVG